MIDMLGHIPVRYLEIYCTGQCLFIDSLSSTCVQVFKHLLFNIHVQFVLKESSLSSRRNTKAMDAYERNNIYIAELGCRMDQGWESVKKSWRQLKKQLIGDYESRAKSSN
jgi:hypothetical protein